MERYKYVNRNINFDSRELSSSYKCAYGDKSTFDVLQITCTYGSEVRVYEVEAKYLKATSKSIHFDAMQDGDSFEITWKPKEVALHIKRIK